MSKQSFVYRFDIAGAWPIALIPFVMLAYFKAIMSLLYAIVFTVVLVCCSLYLGVIYKMKVRS